MIKIEKTVVSGWEAAIRGMRNPMNSWDKSDSELRIMNPDDVEFGYKPNYEYIIGEADLKLMRQLSKSGTDHSKYLRMINVTMDITAPLYWWKEYDTYKVGTVANSCSTMHKIHDKGFEMDDFSTEHLGTVPNCDPIYEGVFEAILFVLNEARHCYLDTGDKTFWWQIIQLLPSSYNQKRSIQVNYQVLKTMYFARQNHKLDEWHTFCEWCETLPYFMDICVNI